MAKYLLPVLLLVASSALMAVNDDSFSLTAEQQKDFDSNKLALKALIKDPQLKDKVLGNSAQQNLHLIYENDKGYQSEYHQGVNLSDGVIGPVTEKWMAQFAVEFKIDPSLQSSVYGQTLFESLVIGAQIQKAYPSWRKTIRSYQFKQWVQTQKPNVENCDGVVPGCFGSAAQLHDLLDRFYLWILETEFAKEFIEWLGVYYHLSNADLTALVADEILTVDQQKALQPLVEVDFAQLYLFDVALKLNKVPSLSDKARSALLDKMKRLGDIPTQPVIKTNAGVEAGEYQATAIWQPVEDCGCASKLSESNGHASYFYGFYPFWQDATDVQINFEQLTRIGYFAATLDGNNKLHLPRTWVERFEGDWQNYFQDDEPYSDMVAMAQKYRVKVDLVVANQRPKSHIIPHTPNYFFSQGLVRDLVEAVKEPLKEQWINPLKPVISFGTSPERTKADGITLDLDLHDLSDDKAIDRFVEFIKSLKDGLEREPQQTDVNTEQLAQLQTIAAQSFEQDTPAAIDDSYYLNMMVPVATLLENGKRLEQAKANNITAEGVGFYTLENLAKISDHINVFVMVFDPLAINSLSTETDKVGYCDDLKEDNKDVALMKCLRRYLGKKANVDLAATLHGKMVPLMTMPKEDVKDNPLEAVVEYSSWSYLGASYWTLPIPLNSTKLISDVYFPSATEQEISPIIAPYVALADSVCDQLCPNRWLMRAFMFLLFSAIVVFAIASIWIYTLRQYMSQWYSLAFALGCCFVLMLLFTCDPYWQDRQQLFIVGFILLLAAVLIIRKYRAEAKAKYP